MPPLVEQAFTDSDDGLPSVVCKSDPPYTVVYANSAWENLCGWTSHDMLGQSLRRLQGPATDQAAVAMLMESVSKQQPCTVPNLVNCARRHATLPGRHNLLLTVWTAISCATRR